MRNRKIRLSSLVITILLCVFIISGCAPGGTLEPEDYFKSDVTCTLYTLDPGEEGGFSESPIANLSLGSLVVGGEGISSERYGSFTIYTKNTAQNIRLDLVGFMIKAEEDCDLNFMLKIKDDEWQHDVSLRANLSVFLGFDGLDAVWSAAEAQTGSISLILTNKLEARSVRYCVYDFMFIGAVLTEE